MELPQVVFLTDEVGQTSDVVSRNEPHWTPTKTDFEKVYVFSKQTALEKS